MAYKHRTITDLIKRFGGEVGVAGPSRFTATLHNDRLWWRVSHSGYVSGLRRWDSGRKFWTKRQANPYAFVSLAARLSTWFMTQQFCVYTSKGEPTYGFLGKTPRMPVVGTQEYALVLGVLRREAPIEVLADYIQDTGIVEVLG